MFDVLVIGGGPAGLTAALYAGRRGASCAVLEGQHTGGYLNLTPGIENYPGTGTLSGTELGERMASQARDAGTEIIAKEAMKITGSVGAFKVECADGSALEAKTLVIATGAEHKKMGVKGERDYAGKGVTYCATCDAPLFAGKPVAVVGGGNTALTNALYLADLCSRVFLVHRHSEFKAEETLVERVKANAKIELVLEAETTEVKGAAFVNALIVKQKGKERALAVSGVFVSVGVQPASLLASELGVATDKTGNIEVDLKTCATSVPGVYAAGDVTGWFKQVVGATAQGGLAGGNASDKAKS
ncbi:MAG: FAD-dependent oxidoreductase [Candidatus Micrarchaeia archaeon]